MKSTQLRNIHIRFFKALLTNQPIPEYDNTTWNELKPLIEEHGLCGHAYKTAHTPEHLVSAFRLRSESQKFHNVLMMSELEKLKPTGVIPLKGTHLLETLYTDWSLRPMSDIDLLVPHKKTKYLESTLRGHGYVPISESKWRANKFKSVWTKNVSDFDVTVELHFKLFANEPTDFLWKTRDSRLSLESLLVHLIGHYAYQHTMIKLFWLYDIATLCQKHANDIDWVEVALLSEQLGLTNSLDGTLFVLNRLLEIKGLPEHQNDRWEQTIDWPMLIFSREIPMRYFVLKHKLKRNTWDALRYDLGWATSKLISGSKDLRA